MTKLFLRFFTVCLLSSILISLITYCLYNQLQEANAYKFIYLNTKYKYDSIASYLKSYPEKDWQAIPQKMHPKQASEINVIPIAKLPLSKNEIGKLKGGELVYQYFNVPREYKIHPTVLYKRIDNSDYAFQEFLDFPRSIKALRFFGWVPLMIKVNLEAISASSWNK